jgi:hypothetical protein
MCAGSVGDDANLGLAVAQSSRVKMGNTVMRNKLLYPLSIIACAMTSSGYAADKAPPAPQTEEANDDTHHVEILTGADGTTRRISGVYSEATFAITGALDNESGIRGRIGGSYSRFDYPIYGDEYPIPGSPFGDGLPWINQAGKIGGRELEGGALIGYQHVADNWSLMGLIGANVQNDSLTWLDLTNPVQGTRWGFKTVWELDVAPTTETMLYAYGSYSTAFQTAVLDVRPGYKIIDKLSIGGLVLKDIYIGPHGMFISDERDQTSRAGAHLTISEIGPVHVTIAGGYAHDRYNGPGAYGLIETAVHF